jgi:hypothetical protein
VIVLELKAPQDFPAGSTLYFELEHRITGVLTRFRLAATSAALPIEPSPLPDAIVAILDRPAQRTPAAETGTLARHVARFADAQGPRAVQAARSRISRKPEFPKTAAPVLVAHERKTRIHLRGDYQQPGEEVRARHARRLPPLQAARAEGRPPRPRPLAGRSGQSAHRARDVNHVWNILFGRGLVATPDNFGSLGEPPSHPELLDYLATEFVRLGWSRKQMIRLLVTSATYRQSSVVRARPHRPRSAQRPARPPEPPAPRGRNRARCRSSPAAGCSTEDRRPQHPSAAAVLRPRLRPQQIVAGNQGPRSVSARHVHPPPAQRAVSDADHVRRLRCQRRLPAARTLQLPAAGAHAVQRPGVLRVQRAPRRTRSPRCPARSTASCTTPSNSA